MFMSWGFGYIDEIVILLRRSVRAGNQKNDLTGTSLIAKRIVSTRTWPLTTCHPPGQSLPCCRKHACEPSLFPCDVDWFPLRFSPNLQRRVNFIRLVKQSDLLFVHDCV